jgi:chromosomal replication initiator protein
MSRMGAGSTPEPTREREASSSRGRDTEIPSRIGREVQRRVGTRRWDMWFDRTTQFEVDGSHLRIEADSRFVADWIERHFREAIQTAARSELGEAASFELAVRRRAEAAEAPTPKQPSSRSGPTKKKLSLAARSIPKLSEFQVGDSNRLAFDASNRVADGSDGATTMLFIHGECGIGKTHLLRGICQQRREANPRAKIRYNTGEQFTNDYIAAVRSGELDAFRRQLRRLDLLAIDDVHFLSNKNATQSEFLHTVDALAMNGATIVVSSDAHPRLIGRFSGPLVSRFLSGMAVRIDRPDRELRVRLVRRLAAERSLTFTDSALETVASRCVSSVREIFGALTRLEALARLDGVASTEAIGSVAVERALIDEPVSSGGKPIRLSRIIEVVCSEVGVNRDELLSSGRHRKVVLARGLCAYLARELTNACFPEIASALGRTTHSTVHTADRRTRKQLDDDLRVQDAGDEEIRLRDLVDRIRRELRRP